MSVPVRSLIAVAGVIATAAIIFLVLFPIGTSLMEVRNFPETIYFNTNESSNDGAIGPISGKVALKSGVKYTITISGTWSAWPSGWWGVVCKGTPEAAPQRPSVGFRNGQVGVDPMFIFAAPHPASYCSADTDPPSSSSPWFPFEVSLDKGASWSILLPTSPAYNPTHIYTFTITGLGFPAQFRLTDPSTTEDNYGVLTIRIEEVAPGIQASVVSISNVPTSIPIFTPFNGRIAFDTGGEGNRAIYLLRGDRPEQPLLVTSSKDDHTPALSPDSRRIAFISKRTDYHEVYAINSDGSSLFQLTNDAATANRPAWSPDSQRLAFDSDDDGKRAIYVMNADGSGLNRLPNNHNGLDISPAWSPDSQQIVFSSNRDGDFEIYVMNADGSDVRQLTNNNSNDDNPNWSPDGKRIVFTSVRDNNREIYMMNADGANQVNLSNHPQADDHEPVWSPDGEQLAFVSNRDGKSDIYIMNADGSNVTRLTYTQMESHHPVWSR